MGPCPVPLFLTGADFDGGGELVDIRPLDRAGMAAQRDGDPRRPGEGEAEDLAVVDGAVPRDRLTTHGLSESRLRRRPSFEQAVRGDPFALRRTTGLPSPPHCVNGRSRTKVSTATMRKITPPGENPRKPSRGRDVPRLCPSGAGAVM